MLENTEIMMVIASRWLTCCSLSSCLADREDEEEPYTGCILGAFEDSPKSAVSSIIASSSSLGDKLPNYKDM